MDLDVRMLCERSVRAGRVARRVGVTVGARVRVAHVVRRRRVLAAYQISRVVVERIRIGASVGATLQLDLRKQVGVAVAVNVGRSHEAAPVVVIGVIVDVLVVNKIVERRVGRHGRGALASRIAANVIDGHPHDPITRLDHATREDRVVVLVVEDCLFAHGRATRDSDVDEWRWGWRR